MFFFKKNKADNHTTYSQCGEDRIIKHIFMTLGITSPVYLDIGAHDPSYFSNTYLFYREGGKGILIEPDPLLFTGLPKARKRDICLNIGITSDDSETISNFFVMSTTTLNTFNKDEAERIQRETANKIERIIKVPLIGINIILKKYMRNGLDLLSLDAEGMDLPIIRAFDFSIVRPVVACIETLSYSEKRAGRKTLEIIDIMKSQDYFVYGDTYINTIFVDKRRWQEQAD